MDAASSLSSFNRAVDAAALAGALVVSYITLCCLRWLVCLATNRASGGISRFHRPGAWAVVTGASRGIGAEFARDLASRGFNERLAALQAELQQKHAVDVKFAFFDFAEADLQRRAAAALSAVGLDNIAVLVNNVGYLSDIPEPYLDHAPGYVDRLISVNVAAMQDMTRLVMPAMSARGRREQRAACCILNISSLSAMLTVPLLTVYSATKAYVTTFSAALAAEYAGSVCVMSIEPGTARTDMCHNKRQGLGNPHPRAVAKGALDFAGTALSSFTPYFFHQLQRFGLKFIPRNIQIFIAKITFEALRQELLQKHC